MKIKKTKSIIYIYIIPLICVLGISSCIAISFFYSSTTVDSNGKVIDTRWVKDFTIDFAKYINDNNGKPEVTDEGVELLKSNKLWIQIIDDNGDEINNYHKPSSVTKHYSPYDLVDTYMYGTGDDTTFIGKVDNSTDTYIIGFPVKVSKVISYVDNSRYNASKPSIIIIVAITFFASLLLGIVYSIIVSKNLTKIQQSLNQIALRSYVPVKGKRFLREIYESINKLDNDIIKADGIRAQNEKSREEWIANITHDLKTPLAPIKGYAEILANPEKEVPTEKYRQYGEIIGNKVGYAEQLINDLKLTYQLKNNMFPIEKKKQNISRFLKEVIIDILNNPDFESRNVNFTASNDDIECSFDYHLLNRAINNIIINSIVHNDENVEINVSIETNDGLTIMISDNGCGMSDEEVDNLFERYYRGTSTKERPEGTGLGMAIAKQIVELHNGTIEVSSRSGEGTMFTIKLPYDN